jgi:hypothetical protein
MTLSVNTIDGAREAAEIVRSKVANLPNLTSDQRQAVLDIALAHVANRGEEPAYDAIAKLVRSRR